ncbi:sensor histidine kinase [Caulobacter mirabilis]|uniref:histidine kinase n=1 Tax=Caulobacter mirabilis TaxID=69666 RepID=A0A2D2B0A0_9CAUL|nr:sensor histidine kinase [Caulobacter mirabilis]ATQ43689.1 histidine kinase [Caulobacter mirabilis]
MAFSRGAALLRRWGALAVLVLAVLVVIALGLLFQARSDAERITAARRVVVDTVGYQAPPPTSDQVPAGGSVVALPHASSPAWVPSADPSPDRIATQVTWYSLKASPPPDDGEQLYLYIPRWKSDGTLAIYADRRLVYQSHANLQWNGSNQPILIALPRTTISHPPRTIDIRLQHVRGIGGAFSSVWFGTHEQLAPQYYLREFFQVRLPALSAAAFLATGIFALFVWFSRRREAIYLLYFLMSAVCFLRMLHTFVGTHPLAVSDAWFGWITVNSLCWMLVVLHLFSAQLHRARQPRLALFVVLNAVFWTIATLPGLLDATLISSLVYINMLLLGLVLGVNGAWQSARAGSNFAMLLSAWGLVTLAAGLYDWSLQQNRVNIESVFLTNFTGVGFTIIFWYIMFRLYVEALETAQGAKADLALRLAQREAELTASHARLREVENRELLNQERQRLMQDMHDGLGSTLVGALRALESGGAPADLDLVGMLRGCIDDLKLTIDSMEPVETDLLLLLATLRFRLQPRLEASGVKLSWNAGEVPPLEWLDHRHALHILRILQEAFANILKHAEASEVAVSVSARDGRVEIRVRDDGRGFDRGRPSTGRGLVNQQRRAEAIGGTVAWESVDRGTCLLLVLPVGKTG